MVGLTDIIHKYIKWLATIALATMMILTFVDVNLRYWIGEPILGSNEMTEFLLGTVVFCGLVIVSGERSHIVVTLLEPFFLRTIPGFYKFLSLSTNLLGSIAVTYLITNYTFFMYEQGNDTEIRHWNWWWLGSLASVLCFFAVLMCIRSLKNKLPGHAEGAPDGDEDQSHEGGAI